MDVTTLPIIYLAALPRHLELRGNGECLVVWDAANNAHVELSMVVERGSSEWDEMLKVAVYQLSEAAKQKAKERRRWLSGPFVPD